MFFKKPPLTVECIVGTPHAYAATFSPPAASSKAGKYDHNGFIIPMWCDGLICFRPYGAKAVFSNVCGYLSNSSTILDIQQLPLSMQDDGTKYKCRINTPWIIKSSRPVSYEVQSLLSNKYESINITNIVYTGVSISSHNVFSPYIEFDCYIKPPFKSLLKLAHASHILKIKPLVSDGYVLKTKIVSREYFAVINNMVSNLPRMVSGEL